MFQYEITVIERERGWGQDDWTERFDSREEAEARIKEINSKNTSPIAPDFYIQAESGIKIVEVEDDPYVPKHRAQVNEAFNR